MAHIFSDVANDTADFVLCGHKFRGRDVVAAVCDAANLVDLTYRMIIQPDTQSSSGARLSAEALSPEGNGNLLKVSFYFL